MWPWNDDCGDRGHRKVAPAAVAAEKVPPFRSRRPLGQIGASGTTNRLIATSWFLDDLARLECTSLNK